MLKVVQIENVLIFRNFYLFLAYRKSGTRDPETLGLGSREPGLGTRDSGPGTRDSGLGTRNFLFTMQPITDQPDFNRDRKEKKNISVFLYCNFI